MNTEKARHIQFNAQMAEHDDSKLLDRELAQFAASEEIAEAYTHQLASGTELPPFFNDAVGYATTFVYQTKSPIFGPDGVKREIDRKLGFRKEEDESWYPKSADELAVAMDLICVATQLGDKDEVPAFGPHINGRPTEIMDDPNSLYNKFGMLIVPR
jgi:hypothetical protein